MSTENTNSRKILSEYKSDKRVVSLVKQMTKLDISINSFCSEVRGDEDGLYMGINRVVNEFLSFKGTMDLSTTANGDSVEINDYCLAIEITFKDEEDGDTNIFVEATFTELKQLKTTLDKLLKYNSFSRKQFDSIKGLSEYSFELN